MPCPQHRSNQAMNFHVDPEQDHDAPLISLALVTKASTDFSPGAAKVGLPDDSSHHLPIHAHLFSEKNIDHRTPPHLW
jgi:hypothetical protein